MEEKELSDHSDEEMVGLVSVDISPTQTHTDDNVHSIKTELPLKANDNGCQQSRCCDVKVFLLLITIFSMTQGFAINGINNVNTPVYERRFKLTSTQTGLESSFYDLMGCCMLVVSGYFVTRFNQPRLLGFASLSLSLGSLVMALPHFITSDYQPAEVPPLSCHLDSNRTSGAQCSEGDKGLRSYLYVFLLGQGLHGLAGALLYTIGPAFIDSSVSDKQSPIYIGIFYVGSTLGPGIGYIAGGWLLSQYVDLPKSPPPGQTPLSPSWVGAWWIGFLASSLICFLLAFPLFTFPRVLPGTEERRKNNVLQTHESVNSSKAKEAGFGTNMRDIPTSLLLLAKNPTFVCQCLSSASEAMLISGLATFTPKFLANQFNLKLGYAAILTGIVAVPSTALGQLLGGVIIKRFKMKVKDIIRLNLGLTVTVLALSGTYWIKCDQNMIAGVTVGYQKNTTIVDFGGLENACTLECRCDTSSYDPICIDGIEYFSACHAGCPSETNSKIKSYSRCQCAKLLKNSSDMHGNYSTQPEPVGYHGKCRSKCTVVYVFLPTLFLAIFLTFMMAVPSTTIVLRCVNDSQRTFAIALKQLVVRIFGSLPGPLLFGTILDSVCLVWQDKCEEKGSCWIYDSAQMGQQFLIIAVLCKTVALILTIIAYKLYKPPSEDNSDS